MKRGFSLIQLLVTITIIGLLMAVIVTPLFSGRSASRDKKRAIDITQYQVAIEYYYEVNGEYPPCADYLVFSCLQGILTAGQYMKGTPPQDPLYAPGSEGNWGFPNSGYHYDRWCNNPELPGGPQKYRIWANTERPQSSGTSLWWGTSYVGATNCIDPS